jgi:hypothetical protein
MSELRVQTLISECSCSFLLCVRLRRILLLKICSIMSVDDKDIGDTEEALP